MYMTSIKEDWTDIKEYWTDIKDDWTDIKADWNDEGPAFFASSSALLNLTVT